MCCLCGLVYCAFQSIRTTHTVTIFIRVLLQLQRIIDLKSHWTWCWTRTYLCIVCTSARFHFQRSHFFARIFLSARVQLFPRLCPRVIMTSLPFLATALKAPIMAVTLLSNTTSKQDTVVNSDTSFLTCVAARFLRSALNVASSFESSSRSDDVRPAWNDIISFTRLAYFSMVSFRDWYRLIWGHSKMYNVIVDSWKCHVAFALCVK